MALLGAHMSIAGGLHKAIERGEALDCEAIQIFAQSGRTWKTTEATDEEISLFQSARRSAKHLKSVIAHNSYLVNITSPDKAVRKKSIRYFIENFERCEAFGIDAIVTHPGSHMGSGEEAGIKATVDSIDEILQACAGFRTQFLLENTAGQGGCIGHAFEHLSAIANGVKENDRIFFCFDTQHAFAAGYDLRTDDSIEAVFSQWKKLIPLKRIAAFHLNDALKELGCRVDRHQSIGKGFLGTFVFEKLMNDSRFKKTPMCLETPPGEEECNWKQELPLLRSYRRT